MKFFAERNPIIIGTVGCAVTVGAVLAALQYDKLLFWDRGATYSAYFAEAGGLLPGADVQVSGFEVGQVSAIKLDGQQVLVTFHVEDDIWLGDGSEAAIKTRTVLGNKVLEISPRGEQPLSATIPLDRTTSPYQLPDALGDLTTTISGLDTDQLSEGLSVLAQTFRDTPPDLRNAVQGVARFAETLNERDARLRDLLANANKATAVLAERSDQVAGLIANTNSLLVDLRSQSEGLDAVSTNISALSTQLSGFIADNRSQMKPALDRLNSVLTILDNRKHRLQEAIKKLNAYALSLGESLSSGPWFQAYVVNLLPGQFIQPFVDAAFSDLGLDPATILPSERIDPPVGQAGTPALPVPFPRTGQGGEPHLTLPDAITGNPGDPRYPYRPPSPQPPPGGPPPGPPAGYQPTPMPAAPGPAGVTPLPVPAAAPPRALGPPGSDIPPQEAGP